MKKIADKNLWNKPEVKDLGTVKDLVKGIAGGSGKEPGGFDGDFAPLQVS